MINPVYLKLHKKNTFCWKNSKLFTSCKKFGLYESLNRLKNILEYHIKNETNAKKLLVYYNFYWICWNRGFLDCYLQELIHKVHVLGCILYQIHLKKSYRLSLPFTITCL